MRESSNLGVNAEGDDGNDPVVAGHRAQERRLAVNMGSSQEGRGHRWAWGGKSKGGMISSERGDRGQEGIFRS